MENFCRDIYLMYKNKKSSITQQHEEQVKTKY